MTVYLWSLNAWQSLWITATGNVFNFNDIVEVKEESSGKLFNLGRVLVKDDNNVLRFITRTQWTATQQFVFHSLRKRFVLVERKRNAGFWTFAVWYWTNGRRSGPGTEPCGAPQLTCWVMRNSFSSEPGSVLNNDELQVFFIGFSFLHVTFTLQVFGESAWKIKKPPIFSTNI